jgi:hypothetical protein
VPKCTESAKGHMVGMIHLHNSINNCVEGTQALPTTTVSIPADTYIVFTLNPLAGVINGVVNLDRGLPATSDLLSTTLIPNDCCFTYSPSLVLPQEYTTDGSLLEVIVPFFTLAEGFTCDDIPILYSYVGSSTS